MIGFLKGRVMESSNGQLILAIGGNESWVGYQVRVPERIGYTDLVGRGIDLFIYTHVREDQFDLFGFLSREEKEIFLTLLGVNKIGPKTALSVLSHCDPDSLIQAILTSDLITLSRLPGIGKKTAERLVVELKDKLEKQIPNRPQKVGGATHNPAQLEATLALIGLGYREEEAHRLIAQIPIEQKLESIDTQGLIRLALQQARGEKGIL